MIIIHKWVYYVLFSIVAGVSVCCGLMAWQLMIMVEQNRQSQSDRLYLHAENAHNRVILEELQAVVREAQERERRRQEARQKGSQK